VEAAGADCPSSVGMFTTLLIVCKADKNLAREEQSLDTGDFKDCKKYLLGEVEMLQG